MIAGDGERKTLRLVARYADPPQPGAGAGERFADEMTGYAALG